MSTFSNVSPQKRLFIYHSYLTFLLSRLTSSQSDTNDISENEDDIFAIRELRENFNAYEKLLETYPSLASFPQAGQPTHNMIDFIDLLFAYWRLGVLHGESVVDSLYRALSKTYASQRLHRYLIFVLASLSFSTGDRAKGKAWAEDALRNLRLYIALFEKSRETDESAIKKELKAFRDRNSAAIEHVNGNEKPFEEEDMDILEDEDNFCQVCCIGTRLLLRESGLDGKQEQEDERIELIKEAFDTIEKAKHRFELRTKERDGDKITNRDARDDEGQMGRTASQDQLPDKSAVKAEVFLWAGIAKVEFALAEADPELARTRAKNGMASINTAVSTLPSPIHADIGSAPDSALIALKTRVLYSLAYAQLELRDVRSATDTAKMAIESLSTASLPLEGLDIKVWHLFVLALSAKKEWTKAKEAAELALYGDMERDRDVEADINDTIPEGSGSGLYNNTMTPDGRKNHISASRAAPDAIILNSSADTAAAGQDDLSNTSSFVHVRLPDGMADGGEPTSTFSSAASGVPPAAGHRQHRFAPLQPIMMTSPWDDLEAEVELWITRNHCIEAVEGPEIALQDLQQNVFTRFSKRRDELEGSSESIGTPMSSPLSAARAPYPYPRNEMKGVRTMADKLDVQPGIGGDALRSGRARSLIGSISLRHRYKTNSLRRMSTTQSQAQGG